MSRVEVFLARLLAGGRDVERWSRRVAAEMREFRADFERLRGGTAPLTFSSVAFPFLLVPAHPPSEILRSLGFDRSADVAGVVAVENESDVRRAKSGNEGVEGEAGKESLGRDWRQGEGGCAEDRIEGGIDTAAMVWLKFVVGTFWRVGSRKGKGEDWASPTREG